MTHEVMEHYNGSYWYCSCNEWYETLDQIIEHIRDISRAQFRAMNRAYALRDEDHLPRRRAV